MENNEFQGFQDEEGRRKLGEKTVVSGYLAVTRHFII